MTNTPMFQSLTNAIRLRRFPHSHKVLRCDIGLGVMRCSKDKTTLRRQSINAALHVIADLFWSFCVKDPLHQKLTVLEHLMTIQIDLSFLAQVFDEIPMEGRLVHTTTLSIGSTQRNVNGAANLLVV